VPRAASRRLELSFLGGSRYADGTPVERSDYLDARGKDPVLEARWLHGHPEYANVVYGHVAVDRTGARWLQYWLFYYYNDKAFLGLGLHEGDWEMVQVGLGADDAPRCWHVRPAQARSALRLDRRGA